MISHRVEKRLTHEVHEALALRDKRGRSKHKDKQAARKAAQDNHTAHKTITGLYATTSLTTYKWVSISFAAEISACFIEIFVRFQIHFLFEIIISNCG